MALVGTGTGDSSNIYLDLSKDHCNSSKGFMIIGITLLAVGILLTLTTTAGPNVKLGLGIGTGVLSGGLLIASLVDLVKANKNKGKRIYATDETMRFNLLNALGDPLQQLQTMADTRFQKFLEYIDGRIQHPRRSVNDSVLHAITQVNGWKTQAEEVNISQGTISKIEEGAKHHNARQETIAFMDETAPN
ncbi:MAG: hypothetical protein K940chlam9_00664 [Chlamydiae bacterium]|nr:hypothetical protein [Chlamydiota bacterium]